MGQKHLCVVLTLAFAAMALPACSTDPSGSPQRGVISFPGSKVEAVYFNPDPGTWKVMDIGASPRPDVLNITFSHSGIEDARGALIQPVLALNLWDVSEDGMTLEKFAARLLKIMPVDHPQIRTTPEKWYISGTTTYGGYIHKIDRAIVFKNHIGLDLICDSTDSVYSKVEGRFKSWLESTTLVPRGSASVVSGVGPVEDPQEVVTIAKHKLEKQELGGEPTGDVSGFKVKDGMVIVWNRTAPFFTLEVPGKVVSGFGKDRAMFLVDGAVLQIQTTLVGDFYPKSGAQDPAMILAAHRDWEFQYLQNTMGKNAKLESWPFLLMNGTPVLYWEATPEGAENSPAKRHLYCTRCKEGVVLVTYSVETPEISRDQAKRLLISAIEHVTYSSRPYDMKKVQQALASLQKPK